MILNEINFCIISQKSALFIVFIIVLQILPTFAVSDACRGGTSAYTRVFFQLALRIIK